MDELDRLMDGAPAQAVDPLDAAMDGYLGGQKRALRANLSQTIATNPDQYAGKKRTAGFLGLPTAAVEAQPQLEAQARIQQIDTATEGAPVTRQKFTDADFAKLAHDDVDNLGTLEKVLRTLKTAGRSAARVVGDMPAAGYGALEVGAKTLAPLLDPLAGTLLPENPLRRMAAGAEMERKNATRLGDKVQGELPKDAGLIERNFYNASQSMGNQLPGLTASIITRNPTPALTWAGMSSGSQSATKALDAGAKPIDALTLGAADATAEVMFERFGINKLLGDIKAGTPLMKMLAGQIVREVPGELATTAVQNANEWLIMHPEKSLNDFVDELGPAERDTAITTIMQTLMTAGLGRAASRIQNRGQVAQAAAENHEVLTGLDQLAAASKVRARDPQSFQKFIEEAAENGPVQNVYIPAQTLAQSGLAEQVAQVSPAVAEQFNQALAAGGDIRIPVGEYATHIAGTELNQSLMEHIKTDPNGMSRAEAQQFMDTQSDQLKAEFENMLAEKAGDDTFKADTDAVKANIRTQLDTVGRFTGEVNDAYSTLVSNFFGVLGAKLGVSPQELFAKTNFRVAAERMTGESLDQGGKYRANMTQVTIPATNSQASLSPEEAAFYKEMGIETGVQTPEVSVPVWKSNHVELSNPRDVTDSHDVFYKPLGDERAIKYDIKNAEGNIVGHTVLEIQDGRPSKLLDIEVQDGQKGKRYGENAVSAIVHDAHGGELGVSHIVDGARSWWERLGTKPVDATHGSLDVVGHSNARASRENASGLGETLNQSAKSQTETPEFKKWFGDSKVVDADGKPLVVYHGTLHDFGEFKENTRGLYFVTPSADWASNFISGSAGNTEVGDTNDGATVMPVYVKASKPFDFENKKHVDQLAIRASLGKVAISEIKKGNWSRIEDRTTMQAIRALGFDGVYVREGGVKNLAVFDPKQIKSAIGNRGTFDPNDPSILNQDKQGARGSFNPATNTITLLKNADLSTFLHESGHFFLETMVDIAARPDAPANVQEDMQALLDWFGIRDLSEWSNLSFEEKRSYHEKFARGFEAYLFEGKAPSIEMQGLFQRFRAWMLNVYKELKALNVELTPEVRGVFDRMLATNDAIKLAEQGRSMLPLFTSPEQAGMTTEEFKAYHDLGVEASGDAIQDLQARGLRDMQWIKNARGREIKRLQKESAARRSEVEMDARREIMSQPVYRAWQFLTARGGEGIPAGKLRIADIAADEATWDKLRKYKMVSKDGMHADMVAEQFGFSSGDELVKALGEATKPSEEIDALTDARMLEQYGELATDAAIEREADKAIHNEARARMIATEMNALARATGKPKVLADAAREFANAMVSRLKVRNLRPSQYANAEARASKAAEKASRSGDLETAAAEKRNQLVNNYATRAAYDAQDEVDRGVGYLKKFDSEGVRKKLDVEYLDQIDALRERFDLRTGQSLKAIDKRAALAEWIKSQRDQGLEPTIPPELENEAFRKSYKDMSVEEFRGLVDAVKQIEHLGRLKNRLLTAKEQREYEAARDQIVTSINENANGRSADTRTPTDTLGKLAKSLKRFWASHIKAATWARVMDGGKDGGAMWEYFIRTANERGDMETQMRSDATRALSEILGPVVKKWPTIQGKGRFFESVGRSFTREGAMALALNTGNEGNLQRLLGGEGWTLDQITPVLGSLTAEEWRAVQAVWDHFESYRPQIGDKERRVYGKEPDWVAPTPFVVKTADGETVDMKGGYYPIKYDPAASQRAEEHADAEAAAAQMRGAYTSSTTRRSFTKSRSEEVSGRPLLYSMIGVYSGVNDVIHDLAWHEWLIDANKLLRSKSIDTAIRTQYGPAVKDQFKQWVKDVAQGEHRADNPAEVGVAWLRQGVSAAGLGFNVMSAAMQVMGFNQSIVRVGPKNMARGIAQYVANPIAAGREVTEKSTFMADRSRTQFRELNELRNQVEGQTVVGKVLSEGTYFMMMRAQKMVDVPTWLGAYEKAITEGNGEERAISLADQAVIDSQGSGMVKDLSTIERGGKALKLFTVFYSYMNTALNMGVQVGMTERDKAKLAAKMLMLYTVPAVLGSLLKDALTPGDGGDDDPEELARKLISEQLSYLTGLMVGVREFGDASKVVTGAEGARDYAGPAGTRVVGDTLKFGKQALQGEFDDAFRKASINLLGDLTSLPAAQANRTITGIKALNEGKTSNPAAIAFGFQEKR